MKDSMLVFFAHHCFCKERLGKSIGYNTKEILASCGK